MAVKKTQARSKVDGPTKHATSSECEACETKCPAGKGFLSKLINKRVSNCPACPKKV